MKTLINYSSQSLNMEKKLMKKPKKASLFGIEKGDSYTLEEHQEFQKDDPQQIEHKIDIIN